MTDLEKIINDILREVYSEAEPSLNFDEVLESSEEEKYSYKNHYLDAERQREIVNKHLEKHDLSSKEKSKIRTTAILQYGPITSLPKNENE